MSELAYVYAGIVLWVIAYVSISVLVPDYCERRRVQNLLREWRSREARLPRRE